MYRLLYPLRTYLIVSGGEKPNVMTADWVVPLSFSPFLVGVAISPKRFSHKLIKTHKEFVIAVPTLELLNEVWKAGTMSGYEKMEKLNLTLIPSKKVKTPSVSEAVANLECKVVEEKDFGDHTLFVGEVVETTYKEEFFKNDKPNLAFKLIAHIGKDEFTTLSGEIFKPAHQK
jgi:flavin reductase (DIM6/NTAB) family NADH-FMN oxidoreductase RutF